MDTKQKACKLALMSQFGEFPIEPEINSLEKDKISNKKQFLDYIDENIWISSDQLSSNMLEWLDGESQDNIIYYVKHEEGINFWKRKIYLSGRKFELYYVTNGIDIRDDKEVIVIQITEKDIFDSSGDEESENSEIKFYTKEDIFEHLKSGETTFYSEDISFNLLCWLDDDTEDNNLISYEKGEHLGSLIWKRRLTLFNEIYYITYKTFGQNLQDDCCNTLISVTNSE